MAHSKKISKNSKHIKKLKTNLLPNKKHNHLNLIKRN